MLADVFLYQVIDLSTRKKNILDLVLSSSPDNIENITVDSTFGLPSHHYCICFDLYLNFKLTKLERFLTMQMLTLIPFGTA